jgi:predicted acylesterase/phospholipase RssA
MESPTRQEHKSIEYCDLVMKGGITSGVVYPLAITELSKTYFFKNIGGTSAGAVAAAITAAAEYGRRTGNRAAYDHLAALPNELGTDNLLLRLFQPSTAAVRAFRVVLAAMKAKSASGRIVNGIGALAHQFWGWTLFGILLGGAIPLALFLICGGPTLSYLVLGAFWIVVIGAVVVLVAAGIDAANVTTQNGFGFCSGFDQNSKAGPPLTNWLHERIQITSGKNPQDPLTFGDLWNAPALPDEAPMTGQTIKLQVVTTNLSLGRPFTIPFESYAFYFHEGEFRNLFPASIVQYMIDHAPPKKRNEIVTARDGTPLHRLPDGVHLPVLVAARMSLSFPILLSAIPLYLPDYAHRALGDEPEAEDVQQLQETRVNANLCWFSDGGICSNFPMHFFDSPLPRWPTFGIDLQPDRSEGRKPNAQMVWFPPLAGSGSQLLLENFDQGSNRARLLGFVGAIINTMQNWRDKLQATAAGYRDRIVHIKLCPDEGGLNLNMPPEVIASLSDRGRIAGKMVIDHFKLSSHIFTRYRITMCALQKFLNDLSNSWTHPVLPQDQEGHEYVSGVKDPPHYKPSSRPLRDSIFRALEDLIKLSTSWQTELHKEQNFCKDGAPRPEPILRNQPKF